MGKTIWHYVGDVNPLGYGGKWFRQVGALRFHVVELTNMDEACGRDNEGRARYVVELSEVDLEPIDPKDLKSALASVGADQSLLGGLSVEAIAEAAHAYGLRAPLHTYEGNNGTEGERECKRESRALEADPDAYEERMNRPVNALGSTAREYGRGDLRSAVARGIEAGSPAALLLAKMEDAARLPCCGAVQRLGGTDHAPTCERAPQGAGKGA